MSEPEGATGRLAAYAAAVAADALPPAVLHESLRTFVNFVGCAFGGVDHAMIAAIDRALAPWSGPALASLIGQRRRADPLLAALVNGAAATAHSFDDTHAEAIVHVGGSVGAAVLALGQARRASGRDCLVALALGAEAMCRASKAVSVAPAVNDLAWYQTGIAGGIGAAVGAARLLGLDAAQMDAAIGIAVSQASGTRVFQGSMPMLMLSGHTAQCGLRAALLAEAGFASPRASLEGAHGFAEVFSSQPHVGWIDADLGTRFELLANTYKAYPCGAVMQAVIDACFALRVAAGFRLDGVERVVVQISPMAAVFGDRRHPVTRTDGQVSIQHWAATALATGRAGLPEGREPALRDPAIAALRDRVELAIERNYERDETQVTLHLAGGAARASGVHRGSAPMSDAALGDKFCAQVAEACGDAHAQRLLAALWALPHAPDVDALGAML